MRHLVARLCGLLFAGLLAGPLPAQTRVDLQNYPRFDEVFESIQGDTLKCWARLFEPEVDFGFRFQLRYFVDCDVRQFDGAPAQIKAYVRVRTADGKEMAFADGFSMPAAPKTFNVSNLKRVHSLVGLSGALSAGPGEYEVQLLLLDHRNRIFRDHWRAKAYPRGHERDLNFTMAPNTLAPLTISPIPDKTVQDNRMPLTVLLNAAPLNPWSSRLRAWDRAFLLDSLASLLRGLSYTSVRVVAFNLEQQAEIFRRDNFVENDVGDLAEALRSLELGTIGYHVLERKLGWAEVLRDLIEKETHAEPQARAVILLGPMLRLTEKFPPEFLQGFAKLARPPFCVAYYPQLGADFPDSVQYFTSALNGKIFRIHSPAELGQNLEKLQREIGVDTTARSIRLEK